MVQTTTGYKPELSSAPDSRCCVICRVRLFCLAKLKNQAIIIRKEGSMDGWEGLPVWAFFEKKLVILKL